MMKVPDRFRHLTTFFLARRNNIVWTFKFAVLIVIFLIFFLPVQRDISVTAATINSLRSQTEDMKKISLNLLTPSELNDTEKRVNEFEDKLIDTAKVSALLDYISEEADKYHLNVIQIYSDSPVTIKDDSGEELELGGKKLMVLPVNFRVEADYKSVADFLKLLRDKVEGNFLVGSLTLKKISPQTENLQCDISLNFAAK